VALLLIVGPNFNHVGRVLSKRNLKCVDLPHGKVASLLRPVKGDLGLGARPIYNIPCECGKVCIGQTGYSVETKIKEQGWLIRLYYPKKSAVAEHSKKLGHSIQFHKTSILAKKSELWNMLLGTELHPDNMNREGFSLSKSWKPLIQTLKE
jgi:hypothetical protein